MPSVPEWWPSYESAEMNAAWWHGYNFACRSEGIIGAIELGAIGEANRQAYLNGQRDMLAKCIEAVGEGRITTESAWSRGYETAYEEVHAALRAMEEKP